MSHLNSFLVKDCDYADPDEMVRDRVVIGCYSSKARDLVINMTKANAQLNERSAQTTQVEPFCQFLPVEKPR